MNNKESEIIDISIRIGNSYDYRIVTVGRTYDFRVCRGDSIYSLRQKFIGEFDESIQDEIKKYNIYNNRIIPLHDYNSINDAFSDPNMSRLDIIDKNEYLFYALTS
tara:strand:- start:3465 stop:3782 length:318 start_codon:yes stop_codon:yes gene_type:complete